MPCSQCGTGKETKGQQGCTSSTSFSLTAPPMFGWWSSRGKAVDEGSETSYGATHCSAKDGDYVVAIDFGTTRTAVAYTIVGASENIINVFSSQRNGALVQSDPKTPTSVLMKGDKMVAFGRKAEEIFAEEGDGEEENGGEENGGEENGEEGNGEEGNGEEGDEEPGLQLFRTFKMGLFRSGEADPSVSSVGNKGSLPLSRLLMECLQHLKGEILGQLRNEDFKGTAHDLFWVLTLPAIWSQHAKAMMRKAAQEAGLIPHENSNRLILALEPECAAIASRSWDDGTKFMIVDCGGGTLDITSHEVVKSSPLEIKETAIPTGGPFGSKKVDEKFDNFLSRFLGQNRYDQLVKKNTNQYFCSFVEWEGKKVRFEFDSRRDEWTGFGMSGVLGALDLKSEDLVIMVEKWNLENPQMCIKPLRPGKKTISLSYALMNSFYVETVTKILEEVCDAAVASDKLQYIVLAGGFGKCPLLMSGLQKAMDKSTITVIRAQEPDLCIVKGAATFGSTKHSLISSRKSTQTFGVAASVRYDPNIPEHFKHEDEKHTVAGEEVLDVFSAHGRVGDSLSPTSCLSYFYAPIAADQNTITVRILATEKRSVFLEHEPGVHTLCTTKLYLGDEMMKMEFKNRGLWVQFYFGGPEVKCRVFDKSKRKEMENFVVNFHLL